MKYYIKQLKTKKEIMSFIKFPIKLYKDNPYYIPALNIDELNHLQYGKNPISEYCDHILFACYNETGAMVGRILGIINHAFNKDKNVMQVRFTRIDMLDDIEITKLLIDAVTQWGKSKGMNQIIGPIGFSDLDKEGMLVDGFDQTDSYVTYYNYSYYPEHLKELGFIKDVDWLEYEVYPLACKPEQIEKIRKVAEFAQTRYNYRLFKPRSKKDVKNYGMNMFEMYNRAFAPLYGFQPISDKVKKFYIKQVISIINYEYCWMVLDKTDKVIGFALMVPSIGKVVKKYDGKVNLFNLCHYIKALSTKNKELDMYFIASDPNLTNTGITSLIFNDVYETSKKHGIKVMYTGPQLEKNYKVHNFWTDLPVNQNRRRTCFTRPIDYKLSN